MPGLRPPRSFVNRAEEGLRQLSKPAQTPFEKKVLSPNPVTLTNPTPSISGDGQTAYFPIAVRGWLSPDPPGIITVREGKGGAPVTAFQVIGYQHARRYEFVQGYRSQTAPSGSGSLIRKSKRPVEECEDPPNRAKQAAGSGPARLCR